MPEGGLISLAVDMKEVDIPKMEVRNANMYVFGGTRPLSKLVVVALSKEFRCLFQIIQQLLRQIERDVLIGRRTPLST